LKINKKFNKEINMNKQFRIFVIPDGADVSDTFSDFSDTTAVRVTDTVGTFHVNYRLRDYQKTNLNGLIKALIKTLSVNYPGEEFDIDVQPAGYPTIKPELLRRDELSDIIDEINDTADDKYQIFNSLYESDDDSDDDDEDEDDYDFGLDDDDDYDEDNEVTDEVDRILGLAPFDPGAYGKKPSKKYNKTYPTSRILKSSKHPKRDVRRHGIIIQSGKPRDRDERIIKNFLKDFIPGNSGWKKEYRRIIAKRWLNQYSITKKAARKISEKFEKTKKPYNKKKVESIANGTRSILNRYDPFYDSSKV